MAKAKTVTDTAEAIEEAVEKGAASVREGMDKMSRSFGKLTSFHKETLEALMESATLAGKGTEKVAGELTTYAKSSGEAFSSAIKAIAGSKTLQAAFEAQMDYAKSSFESYVAEMTKVNDILLASAREAFEPLQARGKALAGLFEFKAA